MIELLQPTYTFSSSMLLRESLHFTVSKVKFQMSMILFGRHPFILVNNANFSMDCRWVLVGYCGPWI